MFLYKILFLNYTMKKNLVTYTLFTFMFFTVVSLIFAEYKSIALWGMYNRHDGTITFLCFSILMLIALNIEYPKIVFNIVTYALYPFVWINAIISLMSFYGVNVLLNPIAKKILTLFSGQEIAFNEGAILTGTLNQWNYMSGISSIMVMIFLTLAIFHKNIWSLALNLITAVAAFTTMLVSVSSSGFITFLIMSVFMLVALFLKATKVKGIIIFVIFLVFVSIPLCMFSERDPLVWDNSVGMFGNTNPFIETESTLKLSITKAYASDTNLVLPVLPERGVGAGTGRLYIWSTILKEIQDKPLTGYGLDTIAYHFPQNELEKRAQMFDETVLIDKPHNMYLGIFWGTGIFGFLGLFITLAIIAITILKGVYSKSSQFIPFFVALSMGFGAFLVQALFNDSVIGLSLAPLLIGAILYSNYNNTKLTVENIQNKEQLN